MVKYDLLVYLGFIPVFATIIVAAFVIWATPVDVIQKYEKSESLTRRWLDSWLCSYLPQVSTTTILKARVRKSLTRRTRQYSRWPVS
jgi:hypothetical protein